MDAEDKKAWQDAYQETQTPRPVSDSERSHWIVTAVFVVIGLVALWFLLTTAT